MRNTPGSRKMIRLQFVEGTDLGSKAIQVFERGWPSHVNAVLPDGSLLGALLDGVKIRPADYDHWPKQQVVSLHTFPDEEDAWYSFLKAQVGKPYDKLAIAAFTIQRDWREPDSWFCSELIAAALEACGFFPGKLSTPGNEITPRDLLLLVSPWAA